MKLLIFLGGPLNCIGYWMDYKHIIIIKCNAFLGRYDDNCLSALKQKPEFWSDSGDLCDKFVKSKLKKSYFLLSLAKCSIWSCSFVMYVVYFFCDLKRNRLSEIVYLSKIRGLYSVLRTWASPHFLTLYYIILYFLTLYYETGLSTVVI